MALPAASSQPLHKSHKAYEVFKDDGPYAPRTKESITVATPLKLTDAEALKPFEPFEPGLLSTLKHTAAPEGPALNSPCNAAMPFKSSATVNNLTPPLAFTSGFSFNVSIPLYSAGSRAF